ncbi:acyl-CoA dehydrogenase family protein [Microbacterium sp. NPDC056044]|uniref:acyl-CoA dehydrogenase family protein n=1 Tax=Microbacterium sp. NPDC056044 TaxID=3345690 RepID=UPI0035E128F6
MDTRLSEIQQELVAAANAALEKHADIDTIDATLALPCGYDERLYGLFAELGWTFLGFETDEESTLVELGLVVERLGYFGVPTPLRAVMSAANLVARASGGDAPLLAQISEEGTIAVVVDATRGSARPRLVEWAGVASVLLVATRDGDEVVVRAVDAASVSIEAVEVFDAERTDEVLLGDAAGDEIGRLSDEAWQEWRAVDRLLRAADILGASRRSLDLTVQNAKTRNQFGRPIGAFQAVQHRAADMRMDIEATSLLVWSGLWRAAHGHDVIRTSLMAAWQASETGERASKNAVQLHGGVGFIKEYPLHHFYRRTKAQKLRFGASRDLLRELGGAVLTAARTGDFRERFVDWPESSE